jgi:hypothetical protein
MRDIDRRAPVAQTIPPDKPDPCDKCDRVYFNCIFHVRLLSPSRYALIALLVRVLPHTQCTRVPAELPDRGVRLPGCGSTFHQPETKIALISLFSVTGIVAGQSVVTRRPCKWKLSKVKSNRVKLSKHPL